MGRALDEDGEGRGAATIRSLDQPGDLGWVVMAHGEVYHEQFGWDTDFEALVAKIVADYAQEHDASCEQAWIAEVGGERAGSIFCMRADDETAKLRILLVHPRAQGRGVGAALVRECIAFARAAGYSRMTLWTNDVLAAARKIYQAEGFVLADEQPHRSFGKELVGQNWTLEL